MWFILIFIVSLFVFQDIIENNLVYPYGYYAAYGIGFGAPFLLPTYIGSCSFDCNSRDFSAVVYKYGLRNGIDGHYLASRLQNFGRDAKLALRNVVNDYFTRLHLDVLNTCLTNT